MKVFQTGLMLLCLALFAVVAHAQANDRFAGVWTGSFRCGSDDTPLKLTIYPREDGSYSAEFEYSHESSRTSFRLGGRARRDGTLDLDPTNWIRRIEGLDMAGLRGKLVGDELAGRIKYGGCAGFSVRKTEALPGLMSSAPPAQTQAIGISPGQEVDVYVPGFDAWVRGPVNTPLQPLWSESQYQVLTMQQQGFDVVAEGELFLGYTFRVRTPSFLPIKRVNTVGFWDGTSGIVPLEGRPGWPDFLNNRIAIWGVDGYAVRSSGGQIQNFISYFAARKPSDYIYIQYFLINEQACFNWTGCRQNYSFLGDERRFYYSQAMIVPAATLAAPVEFTTDTIFTGVGPNDIDRRAAQAFALAAGALAGAGIVQEMSKPVATQLIEARDACLRRQRAGVEGEIC